MAKERIVNTRFWNDGFISNLIPLQKLLFIYLLTNEHTNISGIYELPIKVMALETGINVEMLVKLLPQIEPKIYYLRYPMDSLSGYVVLINFIKYQHSNNPKIKIGMNREISCIPLDILEKAIGYGYPIYRISHSNSNSNTIGDAVASLTKSMKKNTFGSYQEDKSSDSHETVLDAETNEPIRTQPKGKVTGKKDLLKWAEDRRGTMFSFPTKQFKAMQIMIEAKKTPNEIKNRWVELETDNFYKDRGFDFMDVASSFDKR